MAREYARMKTAIWNDTEFLALPTDAQWLYHLILEQPDLNLCGVIRPAFDAWADFSKDMTTRRMKTATTTLSDGRYLVHDAKKHELLARTFVRHDITLKSPNVIVGLSKAFDSTKSQVLRRTVIQELAKANDQGLLKGFPEGLGEGVQNRMSKSFTKAWGECCGNP